MKKLNILLITGLVLLFACGTALAGAPNTYGTSNGGGALSDSIPTNVEPNGNRPPISPVPEPTTMLLVGSGLAILAIARKKKK